MGRTVVICALASACASGGMDGRVRSAAARDLSCERRDLHIADGRFGLYRVRGCGKEAVYRCSEERLTLALSCQQSAVYDVDR